MRPSSLAFCLLLQASMLLLSGCAGRAHRYEGQTAEFGHYRERQVFFAMKDVHADDRQRAAILVAFDATDPKLKVLQGKLDKVLQQAESLDARSSGYTDALEPLARQRGDLAAEKLRVEAQFRQGVAAALSFEQWHRWTALFAARGDLPDDFQYDRDRDGGR